MFFSAAIPNAISAIRVGYLARHDSVVIPYSVGVGAVLSALARAGAISGFFIYTGSGSGLLARVQLSYSAGRPAICELRLISTGRRRVHINTRALRAFMLRHRGELLISTSRGVILSSEADSQHVGGVVLL